jgi:hypothetical protein
MNYEDDIKIDETSLDIEWLDHASKMMRYARHAATMRQRLDLAKETVDLVKAELDKDIRTNPEKYDIEKVTEAVVQNTILMQDRYKKANENFINVKYETDIAANAVRAFDARRDALENLVRLHGQQYFAGPSIPRDITWEREQMQKKADKVIAEKTRRTK